ncbi:MAG TPA: hypothetical protein VNZ61_08855 [Roseomonas sp.]|nr:hypothetical protein [Roseomonas sp.]
MTGQDLTQSLEQALASVPLGAVAVTRALDPANVLVRRLLALPGPQHHELRQIGGRMASSLLSLQDALRCEAWELVTHRLRYLQAQALVVQNVESSLREDPAPEAPELGANVLRFGRARSFALATLH